MDGWDFKSYVLGTMFYRYISENLTEYINAGEIAVGNDSFDYARLSDAEAEEAREGLAVSLDHSIRLMAAAYELWDFGVWNPIIRATVYEGLFLVGKAVLDGTFQAGAPAFHAARRNKEQL